MPDYIPPALDWVREQVELYESSGGQEGYMVDVEGESFPCILFTHIGHKSGGVRKTPVIRVAAGSGYLLIGSMGGQPQNPAWVYNLRANPEVQVRDRTEVSDMRAREVTDPAERAQLWEIAVAAYPPYADYQSKTERIIPVFLAEPR